MGGAALRRFWVLSAVLALPAAARADGAFPDSLSLLLSQDHPNELVVASNFGLIWSSDNGASWSYVCEPAMSSPYGFLYQVSRAPTDAFFAESLNGLNYANDD